MNRRTNAVLLVAALALLAQTLTGSAAAESPAVLSVEPPNWFAGHPMRSIQLLVRGAGLGACALVSRTPRVAVGRQRVTERGTYLIADVTVAEGAAAGPVDLALASPAGDVPLPFSLAERLPEGAGFRGYTPDDVIYLVMPDRFADGDPANNEPTPAAGTYDRSDPRKYHGGDFRGLAGRLAYLRGLGVTAIWMTPVYDNDDGSAPYHGYHATDFYGVEEHFGSAAELRALVERAHAMGLKVIQDQVANHTGPAHPWVDDSPTPTWFNGTKAAHLDNVFKIRALVFPDGTPEDRKATLEGWFGGHLPDLNQDDPDCARYLIQNSLWWVETFGFDAVRQDTLPYLPRTFMRDWTAALKASRPGVDVVGEVLNGDEKVTSYFQGGRAHGGVDSGIDGVFDFPLMFAVKELVEGRKPAERLAEVLRAGPLYPAPTALVPLLDNHDMPRYLTRVGGDARKVMLAQTLVYTQRGAPQVYYGEEVGLEGGRDPDNRRDFPGGFPGDPRDAFEGAGRTPAQRAAYDHLRRLLELRRAHAALRAPETEVLVASGVRLAYARGAGRDAALVAVNLGPAPAELDVPARGRWREGARLADALGTLPAGAVRRGHVRLTVPPRSAGVFLPAGRRSAVGSRPE